jgi:NAD(P)-dependent dehydrogenase (short-subunit alcohol dehydrogenase family)
MTDAAVITGAAGALGRAIAERLAADVPALVLVDRDDTVEQLAAALPGAVGVVGDLRQPGCATPILRALDRGGLTPRVLVNNAGINRDARALKLTEEDFGVVVTVDLVAPARLAEALAPLMPDGSAIVNLASRGALGSFGQANYAAAKSGLIALTRAHALRWAPRVRVNALAPGLVDTPMTAGMPPEVLDKLVARVPAGRMGTPAEMADVVAFLASPAASYVTGQVLLACGGRSIAA